MKFEQGKIYLDRLGDKYEYVGEGTLYARTVFINLQSGNPAIRSICGKFASSESDFDIVAEYEEPQVEVEAGQVWK